jgi:hypothetical protein
MGQLPSQLRGGAVPARMSGHRAGLQSARPGESRKKGRMHVVHAPMVGGAVSAVDQGPIQRAPGRESSNSSHHCLLTSANSSRVRRPGVAFVKPWKAASRSVD